jgi:hypothetical protein
MSDSTADDEEFAGSTANLALKAALRNPSTKLVAEIRQALLLPAPASAR